MNSKYMQKTKQQPQTTRLDKKRQNRKSKLQTRRHFVGSMAMLWRQPSELVAPIHRQEGADDEKRRIHRDSQHSCDRIDLAERDGQRDG